MKTLLFAATGLGLILATATACTTSETRASSEILQQVLQPDGLRYSVALPAGYTGDAPVPLVLALHFAGEVTPFWGRRVVEILIRPGLRELGAIIVAPDCTARSWTAPQAEQDLLQILDHVQHTYNIDSKKVLITGYSMGGSGTWHLAGRHQDRFSAALVMAGMPGKEALTVDWTIPVYVLHSRMDEVVPLRPTERMVTALKANGAQVELKVVEGISHYETHRFARSLRAAVPWIREVWNSGN